MITRFDHAVIAVRDLEDGMQRYRRLGFTVSRGGRHPGHGTENALVRFGLGYLELLAVADPPDLHATGLNGRDVLAFLQTHPGGLLGYALASDDLARDAARLRASGLPVEGPFAMRRERPDGSVLAWQLAIPGGTPWRKPWPFLIQWEAPDAERLTREPPAIQPNGVQAVAAVSVVVRDLDAAIAHYQQGLNLSLAERRVHADLGAEGAQFTVAGTRIDLFAPTGEGPLTQALQSEGEGLYRMRLATANLELTRRVLAESGISIGRSAQDGDAIAVPAEAAAGARLIVQAAGR